MTDKIVVMTACEARGDADKIASSLVEMRLAACVNILAGATSVYRWKGSVERAAEIVLLIKTSHALLARVQAEIERLHPYELPEIIALPVLDGSRRYLEWLNDGLLAMEPGEQR
jgi:periplasmic divalent cation tolerance protein